MQNPGLPAHLCLFPSQGELSTGQLSYWAGLLAGLSLGKTPLWVQNVCVCVCVCVCVLTGEGLRLEVTTHCQDQYSEKEGGGQCDSHRLRGI